MIDKNVCVIIALIAQSVTSNLSRLF